MFPTKIQKNLRFPTLLLFISMVFFGSFCMGMFHGKTLHAAEKTDGYSVVQKSETCCGSTYFEKTTLWQSIVISTFNDFRSNMALFVILASLVFVKTYQEKILSQKLIVRIRWLLKGRNNFQLFYPLKLAFADGLLNPKTH